MQLTAKRYLVYIFKFHIATDKLVKVILLSFSEYKDCCRSHLYRMLYMLICSMMFVNAFCITSGPTGLLFINFIANKSAEPCGF